MPRPPTSTDAQEIVHHVFLLVYAQIMTKQKSRKATNLVIVLYINHNSRLAINITAFMINHESIGARGECPDLLYLKQSNKTSYNPNYIH